MTLKRAKTINELLNTNFKVLDFEGDFEALIGKPEMKGSWIIWGESGNGKTSFTMQLCKYLTKFGRVAYNSLEEGASESVKQALIRFNMKEVSRRMILLDKEPIVELTERLKRRKSPDVIVIDSLQYSGMNYKQYKDLRDQFNNKLFIFISHADGKKPAGRVAASVKYDAFVKIRVEGHKAFSISRYGGGVPYTIWSEGADQYWSELIHN